MGSYEIAEWPTEILGTCRLLNVEGTKAVKDRLSQRGLFYHNTLPPSFDSERCPTMYLRHIEFLSKYGDCIKKVFLYSVDPYGGPPLDSFPNLERLQLQGSAYCLKGTKEHMLVVEGKVSNEAVLKLFQRRYRDFDEIDGCPMDRDLIDLVWKTTRVIDRKFTILVEIELHIAGEMSWVSLIYDLI